MAEMPNINFPDIFQNLPAFKCRFDAFQMQGENCNILFATYPPNTVGANTALEAPGGGTG